MIKSALGSVSAFALVMAASSVAAAQASPNCPPGSWFCAEGSAQITIGGGGQTQLQPLPPPQQVVPQQPIQIQPQPPVFIQQPPQQPPVVVYQPAPPPMVIYRQQQQPDYRTYYMRRPLPYNRGSEWGLNLRLDAALIGGASSSGMGGLGAGLRFKPSPYFGIEAGADFAFGRDWNDYNRNETAFTLNGMLFLNPQSRAQVYVLGGFGWSIANVNNDTYQGVGNPVGLNETVSYHYFGGQLGIGLEYRMTRNFALNVDIRGFIRGRTDPNAAAAPEFIDPSGKTTNTSGGGLVTAGATFYF